jgi:anaerobic selenocysteine-containing dehydrogenase
MHFDRAATPMLRDPAWWGDRRICTLMMNPKDSAATGLADAQLVRLTTAAGSVELELEVTDFAREGHVIMPHGLGLVFEGQTHGVNVNLLTSTTHRDPIAGTPLHRYVPCRVEAAAG